MTEGLWVAVAALIISASTFVYAAAFKTDNTRTRDLEDRCKKCELDLEGCCQERNRLLTENINLMRRINVLMDTARDSRSSDR